MKKLYLVIALIATILVLPIAATANADNLPYYIESDSPALKAFLGVKHEFPGRFSAELTNGQKRGLNAIGIKTTPVQIYEIAAKPVCGDGIINFLDFSK